MTILIAEIFAIGFLLITTISLLLHFMFETTALKWVYVRMELWPALRTRRISLATIRLLMADNEFLVNAGYRSWPVAYLGFPATRDKVSLGPPTQPVSGSTDVKSELGVKGHRKMGPAYIYFYFHTRLKISHNCDVTELRLGPLNHGKL